MGVRAGERWGVAELGPGGGPSSAPLLPLPAGRAPPPAAMQSPPRAGAAAAPQSSSKFWLSRKLAARFSFFSQAKYAWMTRLSGKPSAFN